jgi:putative phosphoesterase
VLIGILSDTHGRLPAATAAVAALRQAGAAMLIHCGDVGDEPIIDLLASAGVPALFVWGNTDYDRPSLAHYAAALGVTCHNESADLELGGKKIFVTHGDRPELMQRIIDGRRHDYLLHGHTHVARDKKVGTVRLLNPGALQRTSEPSVAILDTAKDAVRFIPIQIPR